MANYGIDRFRAFVMSPVFNGTYNIPPEIMVTLIADHSAQPDVGLDVLRQPLLCENLVDEWPDACERRQARRRTVAEREKETGFRKPMTQDNDRGSGDR